VVGVNKFVSPYPKIAGLLRVKPEVEKRQKERTAQVRKERDDGRVNQALKRLEDVARSADNTMPAFLECVEAYATIGEICDVLRKVFGTQKEFLVF
jgi:methylmalonyl-CoA mutase N-terminal domain/subunit